MGDLASVAYSSGIAVDVHRRRSDSAHDVGAGLPRLLRDYLAEVLVDVLGDDTLDASGEGGQAGPRGLLHRHAGSGQAGAGLRGAPGGAVAYSTTQVVPIVANGM
jgi:hypothetical protein